MRSTSSLTITATTVNGFTATCLVTVTGGGNEILPEIIWLDEEEIYLGWGGDHYFMANIYPLNATNLSVTWKSYSPEWVTIDDNGYMQIIDGPYAYWNFDELGSEPYAIITATTVNGLVATGKVHWKPISIVPN